MEYQIKVAETFGGYPPHAFLCLPTSDVYNRSAKTFEACIGHHPPNPNHLFIQTPEMCSVGRTKPWGTTTLHMQFSFNACIIGCDISLQLDCILFCDISIRSFQGIGGYYCNGGLLNESWPIFGLQIKTSLKLSIYKRVKYLPESIINQSTNQ